MYPSKKQFSTDDQDNSSLNTTTTTTRSSCSDNDSSVRSYALIETDPDELEHIIDLLRQFFPKTKILEYHNQTLSSTKTTTTTTSQRPIENDEQILSTPGSQTLKGKVKDYLQRRYLEQMSEDDTQEKVSTKSSNRPTLELSASSLINKRSKTSKSLSLNSSAIRTDNPSFKHLSQRYSTIDIDDSSNDTEKTIYNMDPSDDGDDEEEKSPLFPYSYPTQQITNKPKPFLVPYRPTNEQEQDKQTPTYPSGISLTIPPYSASSDPGPFHSPWFNTPTSSAFNFQFPQVQEQSTANAQGSIVQLSTLTSMLCDEPSTFTPISPRFKKDKHVSNTSKDSSSSSSVPTCQICRQEFDSHQTYLTHYRKHLENPRENNKSDTSDSDINCDRSSDLRNYSCKICSKRFSRTDMLNRHLRLHSGIRPYRCTMCNTYFSRSDHLSTHLRTHTGEKPYTCPQCSYSACRRDMITRHLKIHRKQRSERKNATSNMPSSNDSEK